jgi:hypothetical protein
MAGLLSMKQRFSRGQEIFEIGSSDNPDNTFT